MYCCKNPRLVNAKRGFLYLTLIDSCKWLTCARKENHLSLLHANTFVEHRHAW